MSSSRDTTSKGPTPAPSTQSSSQAPITQGPARPDPNPRPGSPQPSCWQGGCLTTKDNLRETFPVLRAPPRPEPDSRNKADHPAWEKEYNNWGNLRCRCGNGYFCREHGDWISGEEVTSGAAVDGKSQSKGGCPGSHYRDSASRPSYVGKRDRFAC